MKLNWGYKIAAFYLLFVAGMAYLVISSSMQRVDLVTADYYGEEIRYQDRINEKRNAEGLSAPVQVSYEAGVITLRFPEELKGKKIEGMAQLYCPSDKNKDLLQSIFAENNTARIIIPRQNIGFHQLKLNWKADGVGYYLEKNLTLN
jgi:hypothetical protein